MSAKIIRPRWLDTNDVLPGKTYDAKAVEAFKQLEGPIGKLKHMADIADRLFDCDDDGIRIFAVEHVSDLAEELAAEYSRLRADCART